MKHTQEKGDSEEIGTIEEVLLNRRDFLEGLGKWSKVVIGATVVGGVLVTGSPVTESNAAGWANRGGGGAGWANQGGGAGWANRGGGWANHGGGGTAWANRGGGWNNHGSYWVNRY